MLRTIAKPRSFNFVRTIATQPDLGYDFSALEPFISAQIMETHYLKHHRTYIANYNVNVEKLQEAIATNNFLAQNQLLPLVNFNNGGFINHNYFWKSLAPPKQGGGELPQPGTGLYKAITSSFGSVDKLIAETNAKLAGIQGSGWAWIVKDKLTNKLEVITTPNQDTVPPRFAPLLGIDAWEHAYYLQYRNAKADYFKNIWNVINWKYAQEQFQQ